MELISAPTECTGLSNPPLSIDWKGKNPKDIVEKPVKHHLHQVTKVNISCVDTMCPLIYR